jgi:hypothetical protein
VNGIQVFQLVSGGGWDSLPQSGDEVGGSKDGFVLL